MVQLNPCSFLDASPQFHRVMAGDAEDRRLGTTLQHGDDFLFGDIARGIIDSLAWVTCPPTGKHGVIDHACQVQLAELFRRATVNPALKTSIGIESQQLSDQKNLMQNAFQANSCLKGTGNQQNQSSVDHLIPSYQRIEACDTMWISSDWGHCQPRLKGSNDL